MSRPSRYPAAPSRTHALDCAVHPTDRLSIGGLLADHRIFELSRNTAQTGCARSRIWDIVRLVVPAAGFFYRNRGRNGR